MEAAELWLWLLLVMQPHNPKTQVILRSSGYDVRKACVQVRDGVFPFLTAQENKRAGEVRLGRVRDLQRLCCGNDISVIPFDHPYYPEKLRFIENPPIVLFTQGDLRCLKNRKIVSAVGTRSPSDYSVATAEALCESLAKSDAAVVSGLAVGLDAAAHRGALKAKGVTVGVLACGHLVNYPAENKDLKEQILRGDGAIISELLPEMSVPRGYFNTRNRLISGIADAVVVLEAGARSGALLTANHAFEQRRRVFFIPPHDISDERYAGAAQLYKDGAAPVFGFKDILDAFVLTGENGDYYGEDIFPLLAENSIEQNPAPKSRAAAFANSNPAENPNPVKNPNPANSNRAENPNSVKQPNPANSNLVENLNRAQHTNPANSNPAQHPNPAGNPQTANSPHPPPPANRENRTVPKGLDKRAAKVYKALMKETLDMEMIVVRTEIYYRTVLEILMELEVAGLIRRNPDATYSII